MSLPFYAREFVALLVSAMMAFPATSWAQTGDPTRDGAVMDDVPVFLAPLKPVQLASGEMVTPWVAQFELPKKTEEPFVTKMAEEDPEHTLFALGAGDRSLRTLLHLAHSTGNLHLLNNVIITADSPEKTRIVQDHRISDGIHRLSAQAMNAITGFCKAETGGLVTALWVSGLPTTFTLVETSSVNKGIAVFMAVFAVAAFQGMFTDTWHSAFNLGTKMTRKIGGWMAGLFGRELNSVGDRAAEVSGQFLASWTVNSAAAAFILHNAGMLNSLPQALWYGFLTAQDVLDARLSKSSVTVRLFIGSLAEFLNYMGVPHFQYYLATATLLSLTYISFREYINKIATRALAITSRIPRPRSMSCADFLTKVTKLKRGSVQ